MSTTLLLCDEAPQQDQFHQLLQKSVRDLATALAAETRKFRTHQPHNDQIGLALFTLAIAHNNQEAWTCLYGQYKPLVLTWVMQHPQAARIVAQDGDATPLINSVFAKFFQAVTPAKLQGFDSLAALLKYLRFCARSVVCDAARLHRASRVEETIDEIEHEPAGDDLADGVLATIHAHHVWQIILDELHSDEERQLLYQIFLLGMKPSEVCRRAPGFFPTADDVYRVKRNVLERLRRSRRLQSAAFAL